MIDCELVDRSGHLWIMIKHVIPREQYRRKRHEYFHNEEREERLERERERERLAKKSKNKQKLMKNVLKITCEKQELRN